MEGVVVNMLENVSTASQISNRNMYNRRLIYNHNNHRRQRRQLKDNSNTRFLLICHVFFIEFTSDADRHSIPTALHASDLILKELQSNGVLINKFALVGWSGEKLKLGVNNKEDYATLVGSNKWPTKINGIDIVVVKPKYVPDSFALVVRYVPRELEENFVSNEIQRTIASADRIKRIHYSYQRRTDGYRFAVKDYSEYNAVLQLGRIAIGHSRLPITKFYPGNRLRYCTKCWCIGHLRNKCNSENKCRICLENVRADTPHMCKHELNCAQCDGNHHSLDNQCQVIKEYKDQLKEDVEDAIQKGLLQRLSLQEKSPMFELHDQDFPPLTTSDNHSNKRWNIAQLRTTVESNFLRSSDTEKAFESINNNLAKLIDSNKRLENKVDLLSTSMKNVTLDTQLHQAVLADFINIMKDFIQYFIPATLTSGKSERRSLVPVANEYYSRFHFASSRLINAFQLNHQVQLIPTSHNNNIVRTDQQSSSIYNSTQSAKDEAMHRLKTWNFSTKDQKLVLSLLDEWYSGRTLITVLEEWEKVGIAFLRNQKEYIKILCYNVEGWGTRAVEAIDLVYEVQASVFIFTEVGELWNTCRLPYFNTFYQNGTNKNGGVCIAVGKHLKETRIEVNIPNTVIIDITGLPEPVRIIGIYWPTSQQRDLDEIQPFVIEGTIISGDFNATMKEWYSPIADRRGASCGSTSFLSGSTIEGGSYSRHLAQQPMQDLDLMLVAATIKSSDCILKLESVPGFVQIKYDERYIKVHTTAPFSTKLNRDGVLCINGFKMKEKYSGIDKCALFPRSTITSIGVTTTVSASTEVKYKSVFETTSLGEQFEAILSFIQRMRVQENVEQFQSKYITICDTLRKTISKNVLPSIGLIADAERFDERMFQNIISLTFPMYYIQMPEVNKVRSNTVLEFYEKYKYLGNASMLEDFIEYGLLSMNYDSDVVPALKLEFWPDDMQVFLNRIRNTRPNLYELIQEQASMHLIPKWSGKTPDIDQEVEFRYSFSAIEILLAKNRTRAEKILNGVARSIYYRYLKNEPCLEDHTKTILPSYFIKTTVLWMCELKNLDDLCSGVDDDQIIANIMAREWLHYAVSLLCTGCCRHYFIDNLNLLEMCSSASLNRVASILEHEVRLNEDIKIDILIKQDEFMSKKKQATENWLGSMKVKDILAAVNDYRMLREDWLIPPEENPDEGDVPSFLHTLSQLRALDGDKQQNWNTFQRLFLMTDQKNWLPPIWDEQVAECSVCDFVDGLISLGSLMKNIQEGMEKSDFEQTIALNIHETELFPAQNILNDLIQPDDIVQNGLMTSWLPMFTSSYFNASSTDIPSIRQRSVIANHPTGPFQNILQGRTCPTPLNPQTRQTYIEYTHSVSYKFLDLLSAAPNIDMTLEDLVKYYDRPKKTIEPVTTSFIDEQIASHATNPSSVNKESVTLIVFDPNRTIKDMTDDLYRNINDYVLFYAVKSQLLTYVQSISDESIFLILCQSFFDENFLSKLQNLNQVHFIFIYSPQLEIDDQLKNKYSKLINIFTEQTVLFEHVQTYIEKSFALQFGFYDPQQILTTHTNLSKENAIFFWNLLLRDLLMTEQLNDKSSIVQDCREYYCQNIVEMENIERFDKTYESKNVHEWYLKPCFISKLLAKAFHSTDIERLKSFNFFINDLCSTIEDTTTTEQLYYTTIVQKIQFVKLLENIGQLMTFSGFLLTNRSFEEIIQYQNDSYVTVVFEIANISISAVHMVDSTRVMINLGATFKLVSLDFDDKLRVWIARLMFNHDELQISQNYIAIQRQVMERMTLPIIMGVLLLKISNVSTVKKYFDNLTSEDEALIYFYNGIIRHGKGEYELALTDFQIAYELMLSDGRIQDSTLVLHDIGYVYDMKKEFDDALESHRKALEIRQDHLQANDVLIGISLYNIGRTLVSMGDDSQALSYHQNALMIFEHTLEQNHMLIAQSLHSHGVVYFNIGNYPQALHYYTRALELYEKIVPRNEHCILMVKQTLEIIQELPVEHNMIE
ncbi:unnamed protein product [Rotaria socialis]